MEKFIVIKHKRKNHTYVSVAVSNGYGKGYSNQVGIGRLEKLMEIVSDPISVLKKEAEKIPTTESKEKVKEILLKSLNSQTVETKTVKYGVETIYKVIDSMNLFSNIQKSKHKDLDKLLKYTITSRILDPTSMIGIFQNKHKFVETPDVKKTSFYGLLDYIFDKKNQLLINLNQRIGELTNRNVNLFFFDSTTTYFESFVRDGLRYPGYSKDGKFKEDQVVIGMATDINGIPIHFKVFKGSTADCKTMIPFMLEIMSIYKIQNVTIIADKGMSINSNIRFLEQHKINYIISYRLKTSSKKFKEYVLDESDYIEKNNIKFKEMTYASLFKSKRPNGEVRKRIITFSESRAAKDREDRKTLINNFNKRKNKDGYVNANDLTGSKKCRFFKQIGKSYYELDVEKIQQDEKYDGYYIYETNRFDLSPFEIIDIYSQQWQIEENFRTLKTALEVRPMYVWKDEHIIAHFTLCFMSLVILKYSLYLVNSTLENSGVLYEHYTNKRFIEAIVSAEYFVKYINSKEVEKTFIENEDNKKQVQDYKTISNIVNAILYK
ncbi:IS1634 family transposase [Mycoplasma hafezii]|uniref:IS1634 family transposase n=1 Tax=Mycoplasma hafezii TaxID=525886 RepID=UPI003CEBE364